MEAVIGGLVVRISAVSRISTSMTQLEHRVGNIEDTRQRRCAEALIARVEAEAGSSRPVSPVRPAHTEVSNWHPICKNPIYINALHAAEQACCKL